MGEPSFNGNVLDVAACLRRNIYDFSSQTKAIHPVVSTMMPKNNNKLHAFLDIWCNDIKNKLYKGDAGCNSLSTQQTMSKGMKCFQAIH